MSLATVQYQDSKHITFAELQLNDTFVIDMCSVGMSPSRDIYIKVSNEEAYNAIKFSKTAGFAVSVTIRLIDKVIPISGVLITVERKCEN